MKTNADATWAVTLGKHEIDVIVRQVLSRYLKDCTHNSHYDCPRCVSRYIRDAIKKVARWSIQANRDVCQNCDNIRFPGDGTARCALEPDCITIAFPSTTRCGRYHR